MQRTPRQVYLDVSKKIAQLESKVPALKHYTLHFGHGRCRIQCWCGMSFMSSFVERHDLEAMNEWYNEHDACPPPKERT